MGHRAYGNDLKPAFMKGEKEQLAITDILILSQFKKARRAYSSILFEMPMKVSGVAKAKAQPDFLHAKGLRKQMFCGNNSLHIQPFLGSSPDLLRESSAQIARRHSKQQRKTF